jgi:hypothetical protein
MSYQYFGVNTATTAYKYFSQFVNLLKHKYCYILKNISNIFLSRPFREFLDECIQLIVPTKCTLFVEYEC